MAVRVGSSQMNAEWGVRALGISVLVSIAVLTASVFALSHTMAVQSPHEQQTAHATAR